VIEPSWWRRRRSRSSPRRCPAATLEVVRRYWDSVIDSIQDEILSRSRLPGKGRRGVAFESCTIGSG
jgi:hypothetical protein